MKRRDAIQVIGWSLVGLQLGERWLAAEENWQETMELGAFICHAQFPIPSIQNQLNVLTELQTSIREKLIPAPPKEKIELYVFRDEAAWREYHAREFRNIPWRRALFVKPDVIIKTQRSRGKIFTFLSPKLEADLKHEGTHAILHAILGKPLPIWLDEGLAEYFERDPQWLEVTRKRLQEQQMIPLKKLEKIYSMAGMTRDAYGDSWAWVTCLLDGPSEMRSILPEYLRDFKKLFCPSVSSRISRTRQKPDAILASFFAEAEPLP